ncbi:MAG: hypothetical protein J6Y37_03625 [Paludibacteraceae bacterium]|nr:hypothetical protein [Paludibacteraceae bacterium]
MLHDGEGNLRPFEEWRRATASIQSHFNRSWLETEYNTAILRAEQAADWKGFERDKDIAPNLTWMPTSSADPREEHAVFWRDALTLPVDDPFWDEHRPGDLWNCKCWLKQTDAPATPGKDIPKGKDVPKPAKGLEQNPGKTAEMFSSKQPHYPDPKTCIWLKLAKGRGAKDKGLGFFNSAKCDGKCNECALPGDPQNPYTKLSTERGVLRIHRGHGKSEKSENIRIGTYLANKYGFEIDLLDNPPEKKTADSYNHTLGCTQEYKSNKTATKSSIDNLLRDGKRQADNLVLEINSSIPFGDLTEVVKDRVRRSTNIRSLLIIRDGKDVTYSREQMVANDFKIQQTDFR